jgi:hypothetical protein
MSIARAEAYRNLAEQSTQAQSRAADWLDQAVTELAELRRRIAELEHMLKEVAYANSPGEGHKFKSVRGELVEPLTFYSLVNQNRY